jgi:N-acetylglucosamine kinase
MSDGQPLSGESSEALILGVDGGGTKTLLALASRDGSIATLRAVPGTNPFDQPAWRTHLATLFDGIGPVTAGSVGLAGYGEVPALTQALETEIGLLLAAPHTVHNDVQMAFDGAFPAGTGVLILAGTGSMAWAQHNGAKVRVGGWGHLFGDEGSAYWIGNRALSLTSQTLDGRAEARTLADAVLAAIGVTTDPSAGLLDWHNTRTHMRSSVAALSRVVDTLAGQGEPVSLSLLGDAAEQLCHHVETARSRIARPQAPWSFAGGVFASPSLRAAMTAQLGSPVPPVLPPIGGALTRAAALAGWPVTPDWTASLARSLASQDILA